MAGRDVGHGVCHHLRAGVLCAVMAAGAAAGEETTVRTPPCAELETWAAALGPVERWQPLEDSRAWLPRAFSKPAFSELFGAPPLSWRADDAAAMGRHLFACAREAGEAGRRDARRTLLATRGYFQSNLVGLLVHRDRAAAAEARKKERAEARARRAEELAARREAAEARVAEAQAARQAERERAGRRAEADLEKALDEVLSQPDSLRLLRTLNALPGIDPGNPVAVNMAVARHGASVGRLLGIARNQGIGMSDPRIAGPVAERTAALRAAIAAEYRDRIAGLPENANSLRFLDRWSREIDSEVAPALGAEDGAALKSAVVERRNAIQSAMVTALNDRIDGLADGADDPRAAIRGIGDTAGNAMRMGLDRDRVEAVTEHARARQADLADRALKSEMDDLDEVPATLDGLRRLLMRIASTRREPYSHAEPETLTAYRAAAGERLQAVAAEALPEFRTALGAFPQDSRGLALTGRTMVGDPIFEAVPESLRAQYAAAVTDRQAEIRAAIAGREQAARERALRAGGDPDLVGRRFLEPESGLEVEFLDERTVALRLSGKSDTAPYELRGNDVLVRGPGMTLTFTRVAEGGETHLQWLGKVMTRAPE